MQTYCRYAQSLGALEGTPEEVWGTKPYDFWEHLHEPTVFFGLYDLRDYLALALHRGKKWVLWAGSDIRNLEAGFVFNDGRLLWLSKLLRGNWWVFPLMKGAEHWVENFTEQQSLLRLGLKSKLCPSYMGDKHAYSINFIGRNPAQVYLSASEGRQEEYGWGRIEEIADELPRIVFHLYGATWDTAKPNVICHGRVPKEQMNEEIKGMQCGLRLNESDGFSEITAKSVLWGQYPITVIPNKLIPHAENDEELVSLLRSLTQMWEPNYIARDYYLKKLNHYPWVCLKARKATKTTGERGR